jgi:hypothetical protein
VALCAETKSGPLFGYQIVSDNFRTHSSTLSEAFEVLGGERQGSLNVLVYELEMQLMYSQAWIAILLVPLCSSASPLLKEKEAETRVGRKKVKFFTEIGENFVYMVAKVLIVVFGERALEKIGIETMDINLECLFVCGPNVIHKDSVERLPFSKTEWYHISLPSPATRIVSFVCLLSHNGGQKIPFSDLLLSLNFLNYLYM